MAHAISKSKGQTARSRGSGRAPRRTSKKLEIRCANPQPGLNFFYAQIYTLTL